MVESFKIKEEHIIYILLIIAVIFAAWPWFQQGAPVTDDFRSHVAHFWQLKHSIQEKGYPVFWMQELYSGWPIFQFYSIAPYFISLPFIMLFGTITALKLSIIFSYFIAALCMFMAAKILFNDNRIAFVSSVAYTFFAYHFVLAGVRGAFNELWGYSIFPLAVALFIKTLENPERKYIAFTTLLTAVIFITHVPVAYMLGFVYGLYLIYYLINEKKISKDKIKALAFIAVGSVLLSSFWLFPFVSESKKVNFFDVYGEEQKGLIGLNADKPIEIPQLLARHSLFGRFATGERVFYLGYSMLALLFLSLFYKNKLSRFFSYLSIFLLIALLTTFIVNVIPLIFLIQIPIRLMLILGVSLSLVAGTTAKAISEKFQLNNSLKLGILILISLLIITDFAPSNEFYWIKQSNDLFVNDPAQVDVLRQISNEPGYFSVFAPFTYMAYDYHKKFELGFDWEGFKQGVVGAVYKNYTKDASDFINGLEKNNVNKSIVATANMGYYGVKYIVMPCVKNFETAYPLAYNSSYACAYNNVFYTPLIMSSNGTIDNIKFDINKISFKSSSDQPVQILVKVSDFEGHWHAYVDGKETSIFDMWPKYMVINSPQGVHEVEFKYKNTNLQIFTKIISLLSLIALICYYFGWDKKWIKK